MEIFKLVGSIMVDSAEAQSSIQKTGDKAESMASKLQSGIGTALNWGGAIASAAVDAASALVDMARDAASSLDVIDKGAQRMGITAEQYQELSYAAGLCGVSMSTMEKAAKKLEGTGLNMNDAINQLMSIEDESERTKAAIEMFGESIAYQLQPMLNAGADGMQDMRDEAHQLGLVVDNDTVSAGASMNDTFSKIDNTVEALKTNFITNFFPVLEQILSWVLEKMPEIQSKIDEAMEFIMPVVQSVVDTVMEIIPPIWDTIVEIADKLMPLIEPLMALVETAVTGLVDAINAAIDLIQPYIEPIIDSITALVEGFIALLNGDLDGFIDGVSTYFSGMLETFTQIGTDLFTGLWDGMQAAWTLLTEWLTPAVEGVQTWLTGIWDAILAYIQPILDGIQAAIQTAIDFITPYIQPVIDGIQALVEGFFALLDGDFTGFFDGIVTYLTGIVTSLTKIGGDILTGLWDGMKGVWENVTGWFTGIGEKITGWFSDIGSSISGWWDSLWGGGDGSHAAGLPTVPYDGYKAVLHKGETVLNENDTSKLMSLLNGEDGGGDIQPINITVQSVLDGKVIGEISYQYARKKERALG